jgi:hypothetical protein
MARRRIVTKLVPTVVNVPVMCMTWLLTIFVCAAIFGFSQK